MRDLQRRLQSSDDVAGTYDELSMGMSGDLEIAIEYGATTVRVGQAIFGPRPAPDTTGCRPSDRRGSGHAAVGGSGRQRRLLRCCTRSGGRTYALAYQRVAVTWVDVTVRDIRMTTGAALLVVAVVVLVRAFARFVGEGGVRQRPSLPPSGW